MHQLHQNNTDYTFVGTVVLWHNALSFSIGNNESARLPQFKASLWWCGQIQAKMVFWIKRENPALKTECKYQIHTPVWNQDDRMKPIRNH